VILAEALKIAAAAWDIELPTYIQKPLNWYDPYMDLAAARGIFDYFPFNPGHLLTRSEMAYLIVRFGEPIAYVGSPPPSPLSSARSSARSSSRSSGGSFTCGNGNLESGEQCDDGNREDGDGCSSICVIVAQTIRHAALRVEQRDLGSVTHAAGSKNITLMAFDAVASRQDVWITDVTVRIASGSATAATNYRLLADLDQDGIAEQVAATASAQSTRLTFPNFQVRIRQGIATHFAVVADLSPNVSSDRIGLAFATDDSGFIAAVGNEDEEDLLGIVLNAQECSQSLCWIRVITAPTRIVSVRTVGNLFVTRDSVPVGSHEILAGERSDTLLRLSFYATGEDIRVRSLDIGGASASVERLEFYEVGASTPFATARGSQCSVLATGHFCTNTEFLIKADAEKRVLVKAVLKSDTEGAVSGETMALTLSSSTGTAHAVGARGELSGVDLSQTDGDATAEGEIFVGVAIPGANVTITGATHDIVLSKIFSVVNDSSDGGDSPVPVGLSTIGVFRFFAAQNRNSKNGLNDVELQTLVFTVTASNVDVDTDSFAMFNTLNQSIVASCTANQPTIEITVTCNNIHESISSTIDAGGNIGLALRARITDPQIIDGGSTLQVRLAELSDRSNTGTIGWHDGSTLLQWVDLPVTTVRSTLYRTR
jgi:cysteine-rich repeat protein